MAAKLREWQDKTQLISSQMSTCKVIAVVGCDSNDGGVAIVVAVVLLPVLLVCLLVDGQPAIGINRLFVKTYCYQNRTNSRNSQSQ